MNLIIDSRMRKQEKEYLKQFGNLIELPIQNTVYEEISGHPDIFFTKINDKIFQAPNLQLNQKSSLNFSKGAEAISNMYPGDAKYNVCQIGNNIIHNFKYTDYEILKYIDNTNLHKIQVNQGYSKCSISVTSNNSCITSDAGIYDLLQKQNIDTLFLKDETINLLDKNGIKTKMNGFIGGATTIIDDKFILFGDSSKLKQLNTLIEHLNKYNLKLIDFKGLEINDYGSIIIF